MEKYKLQYVQKDGFSKWWFQPPILQQQQRRIQPNDLFIFTTPPKTNMEPENTPLEKEKPLQTANFWASMFVIGVRDVVHLCCQHRGTRGYICGPKFAKILDESTRFRSLASSIRKDVKEKSHQLVIALQRKHIPWKQDVYHLDSSSPSFWQGVPGSIHFAHVSQALQITLCALPNHGSSRWRKMSESWCVWRGRLTSHKRYMQNAPTPNKTRNNTQISKRNRRLVHGKLFGMFCLQWEILVDFLELIWKWHILKFS